VRLLDKVPGEGEAREKKMEKIRRLGATVRLTPGPPAILVRYQVCMKRRCHTPTLPIFGVIVRLNNRPTINLCTYLVKLYSTS